VISSLEKARFIRILNMGLMPCVSYMGLSLLRILLTLIGLLGHVIRCENISLRYLQHEHSLFALTENSSPRTGSHSWIIISC
jgi:hypothetical protein